MPTIQRRRSNLVATLWGVTTNVNRRGDRVTSADPEKVITSNCVMQADRGQRAEVPGQQEIDSYWCVVDADLTDVDLWSQMRVDDEWYELIAPPMRRFGTRHVRHWTLHIKALPRKPEKGDTHG